MQFVCRSAVESDTTLYSLNKTVTTVTAIKAAQNCLSLKAVILSIDKITV